MPDIQFTSQSLRASGFQEPVNAIMNAAMHAADPYLAVKRAAGEDSRFLQVGTQRLQLKGYDQIQLIGFGKAALPMAAAVEEILGERLTQGAIITKYGHAFENYAGKRLRRTNIYEAGHPIPDKNGVDATQAIIRLARSAQEKDLVVCVISGGGSALFSWPVEDVSLSALQTLTDELLRSGATIHEINALRKHLDRVKGGGLAKYTYPADLAVFVLSDVVGDPLEAIASGPTVADPTRFEHCLEILKKYQLIEKTPKSILDHLKKGMRGLISETLKPGDRYFDHVHTHVIGGNYLSSRAALEKGRELGFNSLLLTASLQGEACQVGMFLAALARQIGSSNEPVPRPACLIAGGETTVTVIEDGMGGRNLEIALGAVQGLSGIPNVMLITLATDGGDGLTGAAGAVVVGETLERARLLNLEPDDFLRRNDSYAFFEPLDDLLITGPTQTNVNDLAFFFAFPME